MDLTDFFRGDMSADMMEDVRDRSDFVSSTLIFEGRAFSVFFWGEAAFNIGGGAISLTSIPAALAASCSITWAYISSKSLCAMSRSVSTILASTYGSCPGGVIGDWLIGDLFVAGKTYGFLSALVGDGQEKLRTWLGVLTGETGDGSNWEACRLGTTISISRALGEITIARRSLRPIHSRTTPTTPIAKKYAPTMPPICAGRRDVSVGGSADNTGPSLGDRTGDSPRRWRVPAQAGFIAAQLKRSRMVGTWTTGSSPARIAPEMAMAQHQRMRNVS